MAALVPVDPHAAPSLCGNRSSHAWLRGALALMVALQAASARAEEAASPASAAGTAVIVLGAGEDGWQAGPVADAGPPALDGGPVGALIAGPRHIGYGWTLRQGRNSIKVSFGATEYLVPIDPESPTGVASTEVLPAVRIGWYRQLSARSGVYAATDALSRVDDGRTVTVRRARLGFEWSPFKGSRLGIAHGGLRIKFDDESRMLLKVRRSSFSAYWQAKF